VEFKVHEVILVHKLKRLVVQMAYKVDKENPVQKVTMVYQVKMEHLVLREAEVFLVKEVQ
jgi:hypothetical protein